MSIKIILADDHAMLRHGLGKSFQNEKDMEVIAQAKDGRTTVELAKELSPNIIIMDIGMPDLNGIEATRQIVKENPKVKIIALSMHSSKNFIIEMFKAGASGYLLKQIRGRDLISSLESVGRGDSLLDPAVTEKVLDRVRRIATGTYTDEMAQLTQQEQKILLLVAEGKTNKEIAQEVFLSDKTVKNYVSSILSKLNLERRAQAAAFVARHRLKGGA